MRDNILQRFLLAGREDGLLDLGRCVFCNECALVCPTKKISFTSAKSSLDKPVHLTFLEQGPTRFRIRIFSSRKATKNEIKQYRRR